MKIELNQTVRPERVLTGLPVSPGIATGTAWMSEGNQLQSPVYTLSRDLVEAELARFAEAQAAAIRQLKKLKGKAAALPPNAASRCGDVYLCSIKYSAQAIKSFHVFGLVSL